MKIRNLILLGLAYALYRMVEKREEPEYIEIDGFLVMPGASMITGQSKSQYVN